ncbi:STAS domain-containing protein [Halomonas sediminis]
MSLLLEEPAFRLNAQGNTLCVQGEVDVSVAARLATAGSQWLKQQAAGTEVSFDFTQVEKASSAALSVLLQWLRISRDQKLLFQEAALSPPLRRLSALAELDSLIGVTEPSE